MRTAGLPNFRKLYGVIKQDMPEGTYSLIIQNLYDVSSFAGSKYLVMTSMNVLGGTNHFLAVCYIMMGATCILFCVIFFIVYFIHKKDSSP